MLKSTYFQERIRECYFFICLNFYIKQKYLDACIVPVSLCNDILANISKCQGDVRNGGTTIDHSLQLKDFIARATVS